MSDTGKVVRKTVIEVLRAYGVEVSPQESAPNGMMTLSQGDVLDSRIIPEEVGKKMLHYLERKFQIPLHHFYNPHLAPETKEKTG
jgi:hypothetical protein